MYAETIGLFAKSARDKAVFAKKSPVHYLFAALLAGMFVGFGIVLIFSIGAPFADISSPAVKILMGVSFGIALTLVIIAGSELFTGLAMSMIIGILKKTVTLWDLVVVWVVSYIGNLLGSLLLSYLVFKAGLTHNPIFLKFITQVASAKMHAPLGDLFFKGILCNMLVCLAVWMSMRLKSEAAKMIAIFWCLFAFIACGFEHSIANMTLLSVPLFAAHDPTIISWVGFARNLWVVTAGNIVGGGILIGAVYTFISSRSIPVAQAQ